MNSFHVESGKSFFDSIKFANCLQFILFCFQKRQKKLNKNYNFIEKFSFLLFYLL